MPLQEAPGARSKYSVGNSSRLPTAGASGPALAITNRDEIRYSDEVLDVVRVELSRIAAHGITEEELIRGKGQLIVTYSSLDELGHHADPPMTKDAVAGRIRRLLAMADKRASDLGLPGTDANLPPDLDE
mgnify:CR=1 FL=1